jgi:flagellar protein FliS
MEFAHRSGIAAYRSVSVHGGVAASDPHRLVLILMDGALERLAAASGAMQAGARESKASLIQRTVAILEELRASLNVEAGGAIAANLADLYDYSIRQLTRANLEDRPELLDEVALLMREIRSAWIQIPPGQRSVG